MAKARKVKKAKPVEDRVDIVAPTDEQMAQGIFVRAKLAYRRLPVIDVMVAAGHITDRQYAALTHYRNIAIAQEFSPARCTLDRTPRGGGDGGLPPYTLRAILEMGRMDKELRQLCDIVRAVTIQEQTVSQWAMSKYGSVMRQRVGKDGRTITWFEPKSSVHKAAMQELRDAGDIIANALGGF